MSDELAIHQRFMQQAIAEAMAAEEVGEVPVGAVVVHENRVIAAARNQREALRDPTAHAEMIALTQAAESLNNWRLSGCTLYVTLEPCPMCAGALVQARVDRVVYGTDDPKAGAVRSLYRLLEDPRLNHEAEVTAGVSAEVCAKLLTDFFRRRRK